MTSNEAGLSIDEVSRLTNVPTSTIRYYQSRRLLDPPRRRGRQGIYSQAHLDRLDHIARLQDRGFSLAAIAEIVSAHRRGDTIGALLNTADDEGDEGLDTLVRKAFPDEREAAGPICNAINLGVLRMNDGVLELTDESYRPIVFAVLHLFALGISEERAFEVWARVTEHADHLAETFVQVAQEFAYKPDTTDDHARAFLVLTRAADRVVSFALHAALDQRLRQNPSSIWS